jgi:PAS domain S-box-containing protein
MRTAHERQLAFSSAAALAAVVVGGSGLAGWSLNLPWLAGAIGPMPPMRVAAALAILGAGVSLSARRMAVASLAAGLVFALGAGTLVEYVTERSFGFGTLFIFSRPAAFGDVQMRMPLNAAIAMCALGFALAAVRCPRRSVRAMSEVASVVVLLIVLFAGVTLLVDEGTKVSRYVSMVPLTSGALVLLSLGVLASRTDGWCRNRVGSDDSDGVVLRRMLPILGVPVALGWLRLRGEGFGLYDTSFGNSLEILTTVAVLCAAIFWAVGAVERELRSRLEATAALQDSEERQRLATEGSGIGLWFWNVAGGTLEWTPRCREIFGVGPDDHVTFELFESLIHPDDRQRMNDAVQASWKEHTEFNTSYRLLRPDGTTRWVAVLGRTWYTADGQVQRMMGGALDIDERQRAQEALGRSNADLERFAYNASHDLQEPLRMVASFVELLKRRYEGQLDTDADEFIQYASEGAHRMQRMLDDLLAYSRVSRATRLPGSVDVDALVSDCLANLQLAIRESAATIERAPLPRVIADGPQLAHVFTNLMGNALKFRNGEPPVVRIDAERDGAWCHFRVSDNGIGIESQHFERIFVMFQRLNRRDQYVGNGMGLAIARRVIEQNGGQMWVTSTPGSGSTFHFTLPCAEAA